MKLLACLVLLGGVGAALAQETGVFGGLRGRYRQTGPSGGSTEQRIAYWEEKVKASPKSAEAMLNLAAAFLQRYRETTDFSYVDRASGLVDRVLTADPGNYSALRVRLEVAMNYHRFPRVIDYAAQLLERNASDAGVTGLKGDALMEMGRYDDAGRAYGRMMELGGNLFSYNRHAYYLFVTGKTEEALAWMAQAAESGGAEPENEAWCLVELGDLEFKVGQVKEAEAAYRRALGKTAGYHRANAALGRLVAARGDYKAAIPLFAAAQAAVPFPEYADALDALHRLAGNVSEAGRQRGLIDAIDRLARASGEKGNRTLALIFAGQDRKLDRALELAQGELEVRGDIYTYDALAWALYKNRKLAEAEKASDQALRFNTAEPSFYYHAGVIAAAAGKPARARELLGRALELNPAFDFRYAPEARKLLSSLGR